MMQLLDRLSLAAMGLGIAVMVQPWWGGGLLVGFWITLLATLAQIVVSHLPREGER